MKTFVDLSSIGFGPTPLVRLAFYVLSFLCKTPRRPSNEVTDSSSDWDDIYSTATYCPALRGLLAVYRVTYCLDRGIQYLSLAFLG